MIIFGSYLVLPFSIQKYFSKVQKRLPGLWTNIDNKQQLRFPYLKITLDYDIPSYAGSLRFSFNLSLNPLLSSFATLKVGKACLIAFQKSL